MLQLGNPFKTPEFLALFREWNAKLIEAGHQEIENFSGAEPLLLHFALTHWSGGSSQESGHNRKAMSRVRMEARREYYIKAEHLIRTFTFKNQDHLMVWKLHCKGLSPRNIAKVLRKKKLSKTSIYSIIRMIELKSGLRRG